MISVDEKDYPFIRDMFNKITKFVEENISDNRERSYELLLIVSTHLVAMYGRASEVPLENAKQILDSIWKEQVKYRSERSSLN